MGRDSDQLDRGHILACDRFPETTSCGLDAHAPETVFSAARAQKHIVEIAQRPIRWDHRNPVGFAKSSSVNWHSLGSNLKSKSLEILTPRCANVLARLKGKGPRGKKVLMFCAHYDSVHAGPGAGDDASGVAVVLETLRALKAGPPLDRDLIVLFDDGEEDGFAWLLHFRQRTSLGEGSRGCDQLRCTR